MNSLFLIHVSTSPPLCHAASRASGRGALEFQHDLLRSSFSYLVFPGLEPFLTSWHGFLLPFPYRHPPPDPFSPKSYTAAFSGGEHEVFVHRYPFFSKLLHDRICHSPHKLRAVLPFLTLLLSLRLHETSSLERDRVPTRFLRTPLFLFVPSSQL